MINQLFDQFETLTTETLGFFDQNIQDKFNKLKLDLEENNIYKIHNEFNDNVWRCENLQNHSVFNINFFYITKKNNKDLNLSKYQYSLKSWAFSLLERHYNLTSIHKKIKKVKDALQESNFFDLDKLENFKQNFFSYKLTERTKYDRASALDEYLSYTELQIDAEYMLFILETYHSNSNYKATLRTIPSSKDTLKFSLIIEDYFNKNLSADMYLKYYPIYLWWNLTNIIPLRISEFCLIPRNCIKEIDEEYFITLPRSKNKFDPTLRWDQLWIPKDLAESILEYKVRTKDLGFSKTLLYYSTEKYGLRKREFLTFSNEKDSYAFLYKDFSFVLDAFYSKVIKDKYGFLIAEDGDKISESEEKFMTRRIRPNDTRHFAFLNLMLQGYDPPEIARLGGHKSIYSQYSYHQHLEYWVDSDLVNLFLSKGYMLNNITESFFQKIIFRKSIFNPQIIVYPTAHKLALGICIDPHQNCEVDEHYLCKHWRITEEDYINNQEEIHSIIKSQEGLLKISLEKLLDLHKTAIFNQSKIYYSEENVAFKNRINTHAQKVKQALFQLVQLKEKTASSMLNL